MIERSSWYADLQIGEQPYIRQFENYVGMLLGYPPESCDMNGTCSVQTVVEADGSVYPCDFYVLDTYKMGNLNIEQLDEMCRSGCHRNRDHDITTDTYKSYLCEGYKFFFDNCLEQMKSLAKQLQGIAF